MDSRQASFVLHAPLELLARAALLPSVAPSSRGAARARIATLAEQYERSGEPLLVGPSVHFASISEAADALTVGIAGADTDVLDAAAGWLGDHTHPEQLTALLGSLFRPSLEAAGHANIYLSLLGRTQPRGLPGQMLRHLAQALRSNSPRAIRLPTITDCSDPEGHIVDRLRRAICAVRSVGPPESTFIAPLVEHAQRHGISDSLLNEEGVFDAPRLPPFSLLRIAAQAMLQGPEEQAPYGWTHCLTLAQAPLLVPPSSADVGVRTFVAAVYMAAHWAGHAERGRTVDLHHVPQAVTVDLVRALGEAPGIAAAAAWHAEDPAVVAAVLATEASRNHDAHRVKYTLACLDAAACDPPATRLYLAAAAYLNAWWQITGDATDPRPDLARGTADAEEH